jgi:tripartite-type tricarboxylate transporter receptor subunit TctC
MKTSIFVSVALTTAALLAGQASAQSFPERPVTFVVGYAPGGATDKVARLVAKALTEQLKQSFVVENRVGANSNIGAEIVTRGLSG